MTVIICKCSIYSLCWCPQVAKKKINVFVCDQNNTSFSSLGLKCHFLRVSFIFMYRAELFPLCHDCAVYLGYVNPVLVFT